MLPDPLPYLHPSIPPSLQFCLGKASASKRVQCCAVLISTHIYTYIQYTYSVYISCESTYSYTSSDGACPAPPSRYPAIPIQRESQLIDARLPYPIMAFPISLPIFSCHISHDGHGQSNAVETRVRLLGCLSPVGCRPLDIPLYSLLILV
jgi:hypothetical protein